MTQTAKYPVGEQKVNSRHVLYGATFQLGIGGQAQLIHKPISNKGELALDPQSISQVMDEISLLSPSPSLILIDGVAGAGKTTLAQALAGEFARAGYPAPLVVNLDSYYRGWDEDFDLAFAERISTLNRKRGEQITLHGFDWLEQRALPPKIAIRPEILIAEGVGSFLINPTGPEVIRIWIEYSAEAGLDRVLLRDGKDCEALMRQWLISQVGLFGRYQKLGISPEIVLRGEAQRQ